MDNDPHCLHCVLGKCLEQFYAEHPDIEGPQLVANILQLAGETLMGIERAHEEAECNAHLAGAIAYFIQVVTINRAARIDQLARTSKDIVDEALARAKSTHKES